MNKYIALLRGINVSGQKKIKMTDLRSLFESVGFTDVQTYIQSGNIAFKSKLTDIDEIKNLIEQKIQHIYIFFVPTLILTESVLSKTIMNNPYNLESHDITKLCVTFLESTPKKELVKNLYEYSKYDELFEIKQNIIYLYCPNGFGRAKINNNFIEKKLKVNATTRNWKTTIKLHEMITK